MSIATSQRLHQHRHWTNQNVLETARSLDSQELHQRFLIGQGSVWATLLHLMAAEYVWLAALQGEKTPLMPGDLPDELPGNQAAEGCIKSLEELLARWRALDARWDDFLHSLNESDLSKPVKKVSTSSQKGKETQTSAEDVLLHVCTHAQYTTAQIINMFRQLDVNQDTKTMLITMAREED